MFWKQRAKKLLLRDCDLNTKFFHASATCRAKVNRVLKLRRDDGVVVEDQPRVKTLVVSYFQDLFAGREGVYEPVLSSLDHRVSQTDNNELVRPFHKDEFRNALMEMDSD